MKVEIGTVDRINKQLLDKFGYFENQPKFRLIWSTDQIEKRLISHTAEGLILLEPQVRTVRKYHSAWHKDAYILERLVAVPEGIETDLVERLSYEPIWTFRSQKNNEPLPPFWSICDMIVSNLMANIENPGTYAKYKDTNESKEEKLIRIKELEDELFGNETPLGDSLKNDTAVGYGPRNRSFS